MASDIVEAAIDAAGIRRERSLMVGDTVWDVIAAQRAGVPCLGLLTGGIGEQQLRAAGAAAVYPDAAALLEDLDASLIGQLAGGVVPVS